VVRLNDDAVKFPACSVEGALLLLGPVVNQRAAALAHRIAQ